MAIVTKRTIMSLYSDADDVYSHQVRIVLAEKGVNVDIHHQTLGGDTSELESLNPYASIPTLIDRELVLYEARIIMEYLDERFPHPPLLPVYPVARAESRKMMFRIENDWYALMHQIIAGEDAAQAQQFLAESLIALEPVFLDKPYFLSEEFSLLDCVLAPLLWRLPQLGVEIPASTKGLHDYMQRVFARESFQEGLTEAERQLRAA
ncbi:MAG: glutathione S-transferase N-terminal domain-containing protein [Legionellaceae bacterium]|nr:glutathione S-transferase N-terminal domain-containing protein [Legionellaceae bacterium]